MLVFVEPWIGALQVQSHCQRAQLEKIHFRNALLIGSVFNFEYTQVHFAKDPLKEGMNHVRLLNFFMVFYTMAVCFSSCFRHLILKTILDLVMSKL